MNDDDTLQSDHPLLFAHECPNCHSMETVDHVSKINIVVQLCTQCGVKFRLDKDGNVYSWSFNATINERTFKLVFMLDFNNGGPEFSVWDITDGPFAGGDPIKLKFLPNITPDNVQRKLPIYLLFS